MRQQEEGKIILRILRVEVDERYLNSRRCQIDDKLCAPCVLSRVRADSQRGNYFPSSTVRRARAEVHPSFLNCALFAVLNVTVADIRDAHRYLITNNYAQPRRSEVVPRATIRTSEFIDTHIFTAVRA